jgi:hypothetical protein
VKKIASLALLIAVLLLSLSPVLTVQAATLPVGSCPTGFEIMPIDHDHDMGDHMHAGLKVDLNGDGYICMSMATDTIHVHVDNFVKP